MQNTSLLEILPVCDVSAILEGKQWEDEWF